MSEQNFTRNPKRRKEVSFFSGKVCRYDVVKSCAINRGWDIVNESAPESQKKNCNVYWVDTCPGVHDHFRMLQPWQCLNHFPGMVHITRKALMAKSLEIMQKKYPKEYAFTPKTYCLPRDMNTFKKNFNSEGRSKSTFIVKPDGGCQGRGIFLTRNLEDIPPNRSFVAQNYICNPLLIDNKKFDLRIYVLVTSCDPLRLYLFRDGLVRMCTEEFVRPNSANMSQRCMHLTNYAVNKNSDKFTVEEEDNNYSDDEGGRGHKRTIEWLLRWLKAERGKDAVDRLWTEISLICAKAILSNLPVLRREYHQTFGKFNSSVLSPSLCRADYGSCSDNRFHSPPVLDEKKDSFSDEKKFVEDTSEKEPENLYENEEPDGMAKIDTNEDVFPCSASDGPTAKKKTLKPAEGALEAEESKSNNFSGLGEQGAGTIEEVYQQSSINEEFSDSGSRCFEVLGFDIMVDALLRPWLLEINMLPSFGTSEPVDEGVKRPLIDQTFKIVRAKVRDQKLYEDAIKNSSSQRSSKAKTHANEEETIKRCKQVVTELYRKRAEQKLDKLPQIFAKYEGRENWLVDQVCKKYAPDEDISKLLSAITAGSSNGNHENVEHAMDIDFLTEESLLVDFERIYPPRKDSQHYELFLELEAYVLQVAEEKEQRRLGPAHKRLEASCEVKDDLEIPAFKVGKGNEPCDPIMEWELSGKRKLDRAKDQEETKEGLPQPTKKQIAAAERLSRGLRSSVAQKYKGKKDSEVLEGILTDPSDTINQPDESNRFQQTKKTKIARSSVTKVAIPQVYFEFDL